ncbi:hypothetical protein [Streptomyces sp. NPDC059786]|uniref:hypothetical protein n=1 Tax=Streptomyces sp. NPDC059786 TaxID=3346946 RepID=UPI00364FD16D
MRLRASPCPALAPTLAPALTLALAPTLALAAALACGPLSHTARADDIPAPTPACAGPDSRVFPLTTRVHGGPDGYEPGGGDGTWYLDLTNTTARPCANIHPVVVLVDDHRTLRPSQVRLEFYDGSRPHAVPLVRTEDDELIGVFDGGRPGVTVGPGRTRTVKVRLSVTSAATAPNGVVANAAVVQRREDDGDWVGQSNDYRFRIGDRVRGDSPSAQELAGTGSRPRLPTTAALACALLLVTCGTCLTAWGRALRRPRSPHYR